jgi:hypothetical protein
LDLKTLSDRVERLERELAVLRQLGWAELSARKQRESPTVLPDRLRPVILERASGVTLSNVTGEVGSKQLDLAEKMLLVQSQAHRTSTDLIPSFSFL